MTASLLCVSAAIRAAIAFVVAFKLVWRFRQLSPIERFGLGLAGGSSLLTVPPILVTQTTPFDDWAGLTFGLGFLLYLLGKLWREWKTA